MMKKIHTMMCRAAVLAVVAGLMLTMTGCDAAVDTVELSLSATGAGAQSVAGADADSAPASGTKDTASFAVTNSAGEKGQAGDSTDQDDATTGSSKAASAGATSGAKASASTKTGASAKTGSAASGASQTQSTAQAGSTGAKYICTECGASRQYPNQSCPVCGAHQEGDPNIHHYHGDGYNSGVCPSCGLEYHAVTQEELDRGVVPGSTLSEENGYAPDGSLLPGWVMSDIWGRPVREEEYVPEPTTYDDGCPLGQHLHSGSCNDRYVDGCWGSGHTYTGSCMFAPTPTPEVAEPAPEAEAAPASEVASAPQA